MDSETYRYIMVDEDNNLHVMMSEPSSEDYKASKTFYFDFIRIGSQGSISFLSLDKDDNPIWKEQ